MSAFKAFCKRLLHNTLLGGGQVCTGHVTSVVQVAYIHGARSCSFSKGIILKVGFQAALSEACRNLSVNLKVTNFTLCS